MRIRNGTLHSMQHSSTSIAAPLSGEKGSEGTSFVSRFFSSPPLFPVRHFCRFLCVREGHEVSDALGFFFGSITMHTTHKHNALEYFD